MQEGTAELAENFGKDSVRIVVDMDLVTFKDIRNKEICR